MYQLKGIKTYPRLSQETTAFTASLYKNDKKIAECKDGGFGGSIDIHFISANEEKSFNDFIHKLPNEEYQGITLPPSAELFLGAFVEKHLLEKEREKYIKSFAKKGLHTVFHAESKNPKFSSFYLGIKNMSDLSQSQMKHPEHSFVMIHQKVLNPAQELEESHKRNVAYFLKKKNINVVLYIDSPEKTTYVGLTSMSQMDQVNKKYPTAKVSVLYK